MLNVTKSEADCGPASNQAKDVNFLNSVKVMHISPTMIDSPVKKTTVFKFKRQAFLVCLETLREIIFALCIWSAKTRVFDKLVN